ncbi:MAG: response regulator transcription factor [Clostridia bacterium]|nr:response regulator transcription factor [Clostridia bacterium]
MSYTILLVEDNPHIMKINHEALVMKGYHVLTAKDGQECMAALKTNDVDMIVLDIMLPDSDGLTLCREIKARYKMPILFLSALGENEQIIEGLQAGGDDYMSKPYDIRVLLARIEARLRSLPRRKRSVTYMGLRLNTAMLTAYYGEKDLMLARKEFFLLLALLRSPNRLVGKEDLYRAVWGTDAGDDLNALYATVSRLNKKLEDGGTGKRVVNQRGEGYTLDTI